MKEYIEFLKDIKEVCVELKEDIMKKPVFERVLMPFVIVLFAITLMPILAISYGLIFVDFVQSLRGRRG